MNGPTREEHLAWAKQRALAHLKGGDFRDAVQSMLSDLQKHSETAEHPGIALVFSFAFAPTADKVRHWIEGFA